mmetsp:Transcript_3780/g.6428  ORF Transcript_3780/g.6428 Transcript_3780/m.6428 type:complete len:236 (-) Transcript_3780:306-1013(-)
MSKAVVPLEQEADAVVGPLGGKPIKTWTVADVVNWINSINFSDCAAVFQAHQVTGLALTRLNAPLLAEMGIGIVGRRMMLMTEITKLQGVERAHWRKEVIWQSDEYRPGPCNGLLPYGFPYCCESAVGLPASYKLSNSKFSSTQMIKNVNLPCCACCGYTMSSITVDLSDFKDVDLIASTAVIGDPPGTIMISSKDGAMHPITLQSSQCQKVLAKMTNAKEEAIIQLGLMQFGRA